MFDWIKSKWSGKPKRQPRDVDYKGKTYRLRRNGKWAADDGTIIPVAVMAAFMAYKAVDHAEASDMGNTGSNHGCGSHHGCGGGHGCGGS